MSRLISPQEPIDHPGFFTTVEIAGYKYWKPVRVGMGLEEDVQAAIDEIYREAMPDELIDGARIDPEKRQAWYEANCFENKKIKRLWAELYVPQEGSPDAETLYRHMPVEFWSASYDFLAPNASERPPSALVSSEPSQSADLKAPLAESLQPSL